MLWEILKASKGILVADLYADLWANIAGGGTPVDVFVEMIGSLPLYYNGKGYDLTDYLLSGNALQDGTPSPDAPVDATGCGTDTASGYKLPLTVNGVEYPIYLGEVETTRRVKKLVLTGEESYDYQSQYSRFIFMVKNAMASGTRSTQCFCTHYQSVYNGEPIGDVPDKSIYINEQSLGTQFCIKDEEIASVADFKSYLAAQYAAGTPVTVWYVLATEETGIVNEPLHKIGDYADTVSSAQAGVTIPTVNGANVLDMTSPVKPSEVYVKGKGIKPTGYGQLTDVNGVNILDKDGRPIHVHGQ